MAHLQMPKSLLDEEMVRETVDEDDAFREKAVSNQQSTDTKNQTLETQRNGGSGGREGVLRINADERGLENPTPIFWKPTADMYRMDTPEGREAYEARFGVKIGAAGDRDISTLNQRGHLGIGTPPRAAVPHENGGTYDPSQMHANQG
jgi:hypothetical protein